MVYVHTVDEAEAARIARFLRGAAVCTVAVVLLVGAAVITADRWLPALVSHESERRFIEPYLSFADGVVKASGEQEISDYVERLGMRVAGHMGLPDDLQLTIRFVHMEEVNAFATLGGYVFVTEGLVRALDNENSLAMVLGHEIAHVGNRDPLLSAGRGMMVGLLLATLSGQSGSPFAIGDLGSEVALNVYSRDQESRADGQALAAVQQLYGHVGGATRLFEIVAEMEDPAFQQVELLSTHPDVGARIVEIEGMAAARGWEDRPVEPYPAAITERLKRL